MRNVKAKHSPGNSSGPRDAKHATGSTGGSEPSWRLSTEFAELSHPNQLFGRIMRALNEQFNPVMSVLWLHRDTTLITVALMMVDGRTLTPPEIAARFPDYPSLKPFRIRRKVLGGHSVTSRRRHYLVTDIRVAPIFHSVVGKAGIDWYRRHGVRQELNVPLVLGDKTVGALSLYLKSRPVVTPAKVTRALALTYQAALALELMHLADADKAAAVTRDRERAAHLERANAMLSTAIETFAVEQSPEAFLDATIHAIAAAIGADSVTMGRWPGDGYAYLHRVLHAGVILPGDAADHPNAGRPSLISDDPWAQKILEAGTRSVEIYDLSAQPETTKLTADRMAHLRAGGVRALVVAAIRSGSATVGTFTARLRECQPDPTPDQLSLMQSLVAQAAMALEMGRLTEAARDGAIREERVRFARDLHDSMAQGFTGISMQLEAVVSALASKDLVKARARAITAGEMARDSLQQARRAVHALRPSILEDKDLTTALTDLVESTFVGSSAETESCFTGASHPLPPEVEEHLLRIAQEALTNAFKHAQARHVGVSLTYGPHEISLKIHDDGQGFDPSHQRPRAHGGLGLVGIRERVQRLGARLTVESEPGKGTGISVVLSTPKANDRPQPTQT